MSSTLQQKATLSRITRGYFVDQTVRNSAAERWTLYNLTLITGCFLNVFEKEKIESILGGFGNEDEIDYIVVSDGEEVRSIWFTSHIAANLE